MYKSLGIVRVKQVKDGLVLCLRSPVTTQNYTLQLENVNEVNLA